MLAGADPVYECLYNSGVELDIVQVCDGEQHCPYGDDETAIFCKSELDFGSMQ